MSPPSENPKQDSATGGGPNANLGESSLYRETAIARQEKIKEQGKADAAEVAQVAGRESVRLVGSAILFSSLAFFVLIAASIWVINAGSVPVRSALGLLWLLFCSLLFVMLQQAAGVAKGLRPLFGSFEAFADDWESSIWRHLLAMRHFFTGPSIGSVGDSMAYAEGFAEAVAEWSESFGTLMRKASDVFLSVVYHCCFTLMGAVSFIAKLSSDLHLGSASERSTEIYLLFGQLWSGLTVASGVAIVPAVIGLWVDGRRYWGENYRKNIIEQYEQFEQDPKNHRAPSLVNERFAVFVSSFELIRVAILLVLGLWGQEVLDSAKAIFEVPSKDQVFGISLLLPVLVLAEDRRLAAYALFEKFGPSNYWVAFGLIPMTVVLGQLYRRIREVVKKDGRYANPNWRAANVLSLWVLMLTISVAYSSGELERRAKEVYAATIAARPVKNFIYCEENARRAVGVEKSEAELACKANLAADWEKEATVASLRVEGLLTPSERSAFKSAQKQWDRQLARDVKGRANRQLDVRIDHWRRREDVIRRIESRYAHRRDKK